MKEIYKTTTNFFGGNNMYGVVRRIDDGKPENGGNRVVFPRYFDDADTAREVADWLNKELVSLRET